MPRRPAPPLELLEYHEGPPAIVRDMEEWLAVGDRRAAAESVRRWLVESYALGPARTTKVGAAKASSAKARSAKARSAKARPTPGSPARQARRAQK